MTDQPAFSTEMVHSNERIEIEPATQRWMPARGISHADLIRDLETMRDQILRHVDGASHRTVHVVWDSAPCCTHCKEPVAKGTFDNGEPACCDEAIAEWVASGGVIAE